MSRWADIDAIIDMSISVLCGGGNEEMAVLVEDINSIPSIEIIRCRECKNAHLTYDGECKYCECWKDDDDNYIELYLDGDFFCGFGEREGE